MQTDRQGAVKMKHDKSNDAAARLEHLVPGGAMTYARGSDQYPENLAPVIDRGRGAEVWDLDGNRYIEFGAGLRSVILGHAYPEVNEAAAKAMEGGCSFVRPARIELEAAKTLLAAVPDMDMVKFSKNGSDVTTAAVRLARSATDRLKVAICADHPFFSVDDWFIGTTPMNSGIPAAIRSMTETFAYGDIDSLEQLLGSDPDGFACVILEPEKYERAPDGYLEAVRAVCDRYGCVLVFDEMITGFRHHFGGVHVRDGIRPDLVAFGKAIGNGFANSALVGSRELMSLGGFDHDRERVFLLSTTHGAETVGLAATIATLNALKEHAVLDVLVERGQTLKDRINSAAADLGLEDYFEVIGMPADLVYVTRGPDRKPSQRYRTLFMQETIRRGLLAPSLVINFGHDDAILDETVAIIREALEIYGKAIEGGSAEPFLDGRPVRPAFRRFR